MSAWNAARWLVVAAAAAAATVTPHVTRGEPPAAVEGFPGWPATYEGRALAPLPLTRREAFLARDFPGRVGRFTDGRSEIVLRWVRGPTRQLHPAADCFRGLGWRVATAPMQLASDGRPMSCIRVMGPDGQVLGVCERIRLAPAGSPALSADTPPSKEFPDVSAWFWHALWHGKGEAWWSVVIATPI